MGIETLQVCFVGVAYGCGYLGVALISQIVRMSRFVLDPPLYKHMGRIIKYLLLECDYYDYDTRHEVYIIGQ